jgi:hypothetical protein
VEGRDWQAGHYLAATCLGTIVVKPLFEISDEIYAVYFSNRPK